MAVLYILLHAFMKNLESNAGVFGLNLKDPVLI